MHPLDAELRRRQEYGRTIEIGSDVWVGGGALILPGVRIGSRSVIGAGSVVTRDIPEGVFVAGNPCRVIREVTEETLCRTSVGAIARSTTSHCNRRRCAPHRRPSLSRAERGSVH